MNKRSFSLIEVLIASSLLAILLSSLFYAYRSFSIDQKEAQKLLKPFSEERYAHIKLSRTLVQAKKEKETLFNNQGKDLFFVFDHGTHPEPLLSGHVLGHLFLDKSNEKLLLEVSPHPQSEKSTPKMIYEILDKVKDVSYEFYFPGQEPLKIVDPQKVGDSLPQTGWQQEWKKGYQELPTFVKVNVKRPLFFKKREDLELTYHIEEKNREINFLR